MLEAIPRWTFTTRYCLTQWYEHVHLLSDRVLGQWFCLNRSNGQPLWEGKFVRPNAVMGVSSGVVVASEWRSDGPWTTQLGCYGISLETGQLLWTSHAKGWWGRLVRLLDFVPAFTNELRDTPKHVFESEVICDSGRILDVHTGKELRRIVKEEVQRLPTGGRDSIAQRLFHDGEVELVGGLRLSNNSKVADDRIHWARGKLRFSLVDRFGQELWVFDLANTGYQIDGNFYSYRLEQSYVYLAVSEEEQARPSSESLCVMANPTVYHLLSLDLAQGTVVQDIRVAAVKLDRCRIEDVDDEGLLLSTGERQLRYYHRVQDKSPAK